MNGCGNGGYSAAVRLFVELAGERMPLAQVGGGRLYFDRPVLLPAGPATVIVEIDGQADCSPVVLRSQDGPSKIVAYSDA